MRISIIIFFILIFPVSTFAAEINATDFATYELYGKDGKSSQMFLRLSQNSGKWLMEGKNGPALWKDITCDGGCEYRIPTPNEIASYFKVLPSGMAVSFNMACIKNNANAFCRVTKKENPAQGGYVLFALVTGKPVPMSLTRLTR